MVGLDEIMGLKKVRWWKQCVNCLGVSGKNKCSLFTLHAVPHKEIIGYGQLILHP